MPEVDEDGWPIRPDGRPLLAAIGLLMLEFAHLEHEMHTLFCLLTEVSRDAAKIVFPDLTSRTVRNYLTPLIEISKMPQWAKGRLTYVLQQYDRIATMRNHLAHRKNLFDSETATVIKSFHAKRGQSLKESIDYNIPDMELASKDLEIMQYQLDFISANLLVFIRHSWEFEPDNHDVFQHSWLYIPSGQSPLRHPSQHSSHSKSPKKNAE